MELLLNLLWVLLAASVFCRWSRRQNDPRSRAHLIALFCLLALLFPVISATDDLHAMRPEMEDAASNRRALKQASGASMRNPFPSVPALLTTAGMALAHRETSSLAPVVRVSTPSSRPLKVECGRAPPFLELV